MFQSEGSLSKVTLFFVNKIQFHLIILCQQLYISDYPPISMYIKMCHCDENSADRYECVIILNEELLPINILKVIKTVLLMFVTY